MDSQLSHLYFGARQTCLEMLKDRGYMVPKHLESITEPVFQKTPLNYMELFGITDTQERPVFVKMTTNMEKKALFSEVVNLLRNNGIEVPKLDTDEKSVNELKDLRIIIIYDPVQSESNLKNLISSYIGHPVIEAFDVHYLFINPTKHIYQSKWRLMNEKEIIELLQKIEAKTPHPSRVMLSAVCIDDPMNRYYGGKPPGKERKNGDVYEIIRDGVGIAYRRVINKRMNLKEK